MKYKRGSLIQYTTETRIKGLDNLGIYINNTNYFLKRVIGTGYVINESNFYKVKEGMLMYTGYPIESMPLMKIKEWGV